jgi:hypothetical protein
MNNKIKIAVGTSGAAILVLLLHLWHVAHTVNSIGEKDNNDVFKNASVHIILTDSTGKKDTMIMEDYLKKKK